MTNEEAKLLLDKYNQGLATTAEVALLQYWYVREATKAEVDMDVRQLEQLMDDMRAEVLTQTKSVEVSIWPRIAVAAAAVVAIVFGVWFYNSGHLGGGEATRDLSNYAKDDIAPGQNGATLTLANGKTIDLSSQKNGVVIGSEKFTYNDGTNINDPALNKAISPKKDERSMMLTASTAKGQTYQITLPDGTEVWLNADSKISFPSQFIGKERKIVLDGEGYFEVAKNKAKPFIVQTDKQIVEVLGTHFNINSYSDEATVRTTLLEGSVQVFPLPGAEIRRNHENGIILKPGQQSLITDDRGISVKEIDVEEAVLWKSGKFSFSSEEMASVMRKIARWYNVNIIYKDDVENVKVTGSVSRFADISSLLDKLEQTGSVHFKLEGRTIILTKK